LSASCSPYFHLFGPGRDDVDYIMQTFPIVKRKDEAAFGSYRTKELILAAYDVMQAAMDGGVPYASPLGHLVDSEREACGRNLRCTGIVGGRP